MFHILFFLHVVPPEILISSNSNFFAGENSSSNPIFLFFPPDFSRITGRRRLEIRSAGTRSSVFMVVCTGLRGWHVLHHPSSAITLRHNKSYRYSIFKNRQEETRATENGEHGHIAEPRGLSWNVGMDPHLAKIPGKST